MKNPLRLEKAVSSDSEIIEALAKEIWEQHYIPIIGKAQVDYMLENFQSQNAIEQDISGGLTYYTAYYDDNPCGYFAIQAKHNGIFLSKLYVKQSFRKKGIAKAMLEQIDADAKEANVHFIFLTCNKLNQAALNAYQRLGFAIIGEQVSDIGNGFVMDDYVLEKTLCDTPRTDMEV